MAHIRLKNVNLSIPIYEGSARRLLRLPSFGKAGVGSRRFSGNTGALWVHALNDLSMDIKEGERVALIGHNGSGKSTLLKVMAGVYPVQKGEVSVEGSIQSMLETAVALNPDATGYENIRLVATLANWPREKMQDYVTDIEEFTELGDYLSLPIRVYSGGMHARLAFAIATMQAPGILLIDENIGAGDAQFQEKVEERVNAIFAQVKILVVASHSRELLETFCNKGALFSKGRLLYFGDLQEAFRLYSQPEYFQDTPIC